MLKGAAVPLDACEDCPEGRQERPNVEDGLVVVNDAPDEAVDDRDEQTGTATAIVQRGGLQKDN
jgi:hypothetical protein